jgi:hypothetical protein
MMTRKDYVNVADILNLFRDSMDKHLMTDLVNEFSDFFIEDNPRFNSQKFSEAVFAE